MMIVMMIVMTVTMKMKMILLHLDNHKNALEILLRLFIKFYKIFNFFLFGRYKSLLSHLKMYNKTHQIVHLIAYECFLRFNK